MYSKQLTELFEKHGIKVMDKVRVASKGMELEGEVMPSTEVGNPNTIVIKLENGYNVGIAYSSDIKISKVASGSGTPSFPKAKVGKSKDLPTVSLIYCGGTIGSKVDYKTGGVHMLLDPGELLHEVPELAEIANVEIKHLFSIDSAEITYIEWQTMAKEIESAFNGGARGVVLTMGTDCMHYTAAALSFMLGYINGPVVVTGAQRSSDRGSSDAFLNLMCAVKLAATSNVAEVGVCMHNSSSDDKCAFIRGTRVRKMHTSRRDAFRAINDKPIAFVDRDLRVTYNAHYHQVSEGEKKKVALFAKYEPKVALIKSHPNFDPAVIDFYIKRGYKGMIFEGTGLGNVPAMGLHKEFSWYDNIKKAVDSGVVVGMTSQCLYGRVHDSVYRLLRVLSELGVVYCDDMLPETAMVKLGWLLGNYKPDEAKAMLRQGLRGEMNSRTLNDQFLI